MPQFVTLCVVVLIFLNGATDASGAIAAAVASGTISMRRAAVLAAVGNGIGGILAAAFFGEIGDAVASLADFGMFTLQGVLATLAAAVLFTAAAWLLHIPTSESHTLLAAAAGARAALGDGGVLSAVLPAVFWMTLCTAGGCAAGCLFSRAVPRRLPMRTVRRWQILCAFVSSVLHGVQDLPKFLVLLSVVGMSLTLPLWAVGTFLISLGSLLGGRRMAEAVGEDLATLTPHGALAADFSSAAVLFLLSVCGVPASTTHAKTSSVIGTALCADGCTLIGRQALLFLIGWLSTFPLAAALGYGCAKGILFVF